MARKVLAKGGVTVFDEVDCETRVRLKF